LLSYVEIEFLVELMERFEQVLKVDEELKERLEE